MEENKETLCPICKSAQAFRLLNLDCGNLDPSTLYSLVKINACEKCGHIYNDLSSEDITGLMKYYNEEYGPVNMSSTDKVGDRPGSTNSFTCKRHALLYDLVAPYIHKDSRALDVGCAMGGFLDYLHQKGLTKLYGVDIIEDYVSYAKKKGIYTVKLGSAESIPFDENSLDLVVVDQVVEHLVDPIQVFKEAKRVLAEDGLLCIGVPDASRYDKLYFFDFFWFLMREHIQHFDLEHLKLLAGLEGFEFVTHCEAETPMMSEKMILPNLNVVFRKTNKKGQLHTTENCFKLKKEMEQYIANDLKKLNNKKALIKKFINSKKPLYAWGIGREFLYLYASAGLKNCNLVGLIDTNSLKQSTFSVEEKSIHDKNILKEAPANSALLITAIAHTSPIKKVLFEMRYQGQIVEI
ncbi:MAG: class I SAM-dependent methyltransferase [Candidatus Gracilibacteria bacterium]